MEVFSSPSQLQALCRYLHSACISLGGTSNFFSCSCIKAPARYILRTEFHVPLHSNASVGKHVLWHLFPPVQMSTHVLRISEEIKIPIFENSPSVENASRNGDFSKRGSWPDDSSHHDHHPTPRPKVSKHRRPSDKTDEATFIIYQR